MKLWGSNLRPQASACDHSVNLSWCACMSAHSEPHRWYTNMEHAPMHKSLRGLNDHSWLRFMHNSDRHLVIIEALGMGYFFRIRRRTIRACLAVLRFHTLTAAQQLHTSALSCDTNNTRRAGHTQELVQRIDIVRHSLSCKSDPAATHFLWISPQLGLWPDASIPQTQARLGL